MHVVISANPKLMKELMGMKMHPEVRRMLEESGLTQEWVAEGEAKAEAERQRLMRKQERVMRENERLKREIAKLKQAARSKVKA
jgi:hypothetical protein